MKEIAGVAQVEPGAGGNSFRIIGRQLFAAYQEGAEAGVQIHQDGDSPVPTQPAVDPADARGPVREPHRTGCVPAKPQALGPQGEGLPLHGPIDALYLHGGPLRDVSAFMARCRGLGAFGVRAEGIGPGLAVLRHPQD